MWPLSHIYTTFHLIIYIYSRSYSMHQQTTHAVTFRLALSPGLPPIYTLKQAAQSITYLQPLQTQSRNTNLMISMYPWITLVAIIWLQTINGTNTTFPAYSAALKSRLGISQINLNNLAAASDLGKVFGWCSGLALSHSPRWPVLITGALIGVFGYGVQFLFLIGKFSTLKYWQAFLLCMIAGNSICWINTVCYVAAMQKFPAEHGIVVSLATSYSGISAKAS
jgi:Nodulin-like